MLCVSKCGCWNGCAQSAATAHGITIGADEATPFGLIVAELIAIAIDHGFADGARGMLDVRMRMADGARIMTVADDVTGVPADFGPAQSRSLGMRIIHPLADQLGGQLVYIKSGLSGKRGLTTHLILKPAETA